MRPTYLVGWDAIARHLGNVSSRTVVRWFKDSRPRMPVHRVTPNGTVMARVVDLDDWWRKKTAM